ncbi:MAG: putative Ig domain-containing protein [Armatimonadota bacterium]
MPWRTIPVCTVRLEIPLRKSPLLFAFLLALAPLVAAASPVSAQGAKETDPLEIKLPSELDRVIRCGNGDLLLFQMNKLAKVAVFDIRTEKIIGYVPLGGNDTLVAGNADSILLLARDKKVLQRWTLRPLTEPVDGITAGYASTAPVLIMTRQGPRFLNPTTLKLIAADPAQGRNDWHPHPQYPIEAAASADGSTFAGWVPGLSPSGIRTLRLQGSTLMSKYEHESVGPQYPSADGALIFTSSGVYSTDLKPLDREQGQSLTTFPTLSPAYYIGVRTGRFGEESKPTVSVFNTGDRTILLTFDSLPGMGKIDPFNRDFLGLANRIIAHPAAKKLVIVDEKRTSLHVLPLDIVKALNEKEIDYLFVESLPITTVSPGKPYTYAIKVLSKAGKVKYTLDSGPKGMTLSPTGVLRWNVPANFDEENTSVIVTIEDGSKQSLFHTFSLFRSDAAKPAATGSGSLK